MASRKKNGSKFSVVTCTSPFIPDPEQGNGVKNRVSVAIVFRLVDPGFEGREFMRPVVVESRPVSIADFNFQGVAGLISYFEDRLRSEDFEMPVDLYGVFRYGRWEIKAKLWEAIDSLVEEREKSVCIRLGFHLYLEESLIGAAMRAGDWLGLDEDGNMTLAWDGLETVPYMLGGHCPICLEEFREWEPLKALRGDGSRHAFHARCITTWLRENPCCPLCRHAYASA